MQRARWWHGDTTISGDGTEREHHCTCFKEAERREAMQREMSYDFFLVGYPENSFDELVNYNKFKKQ